MSDLIPIILILVFFALSFFVERIMGRRVRILLGSGLVIYFLAMFFIASENRYPYLFCAIISSLYILRPGSSQHRAN